MRRALLPATLGAVLVACGGGAERDAAPAAGTAHGAAAMIRADHAPELVFMTRVAGDDPLPFSISLRADGNAAVRFGGGHGGWHDKAIELSDAQQARARRLIAAAPWRRLAGNTVEPGGFGGDDNGNRYMLRRAGRSVTVAEGHMPRSMSRLVRMLDAIIDGDLGHEVARQMHNGISATTTGG